MTLIMSKTESESVRIGVTERDDSFRFFFFQKEGRKRAWLKTTNKDLAFIGRNIVKGEKKTF